jgi:hypothetical protein
MGLLSKLYKDAGEADRTGTSQAHTTTSTILTVIVSRGKPPAPIIVRCLKDGKLFLDLSSPGSFNHHFTDLSDGDYDIYIIGFNDKNGGETTCYLSEEHIKVIPPDVSPLKSDKPAFLVGFHFTVGEG